MLATSYTLSATTELPFADAVERVRGALKDNGFGVLVRDRRPGDAEGEARRRGRALRDPRSLQPAARPPGPRGRARPRRAPALQRRRLRARQRDAHLRRRRGADAVDRRQRRARSRRRRGAGQARRRGRARRRCPAPPEVRYGAGRATPQGTRKRAPGACFARGGG